MNFRQKCLVSGNEKQLCFLKKDFGGGGRGGGGGVGNSLLKKEAPGCRGRLIQHLSQMTGEESSRQKTKYRVYSNPTQVVAGREKAH